MPDSELVEKGLPCPDPDCGSSDAAALYSDGHLFCFSCNRRFASGDAGTKRERPRAVSEDLASIIHSGEIRAVKSRGISQATARHWGYRLRRRQDGAIEHIAVYCDDRGNPIAAKIRNTGTPEEPAKDFFIEGDGKHMGLWGRHLWRDKGRMVVIAEGELDAMSVSQAFGNSYPVVSVPKGAAGAKKAIAEALDWLNGFESVVFMYDMDEPGRAAAEECAKLIAPGKAKIASLPGGFKDPNEMLLAGQAKEIANAAWGAKTFRPDGIVDARELTSRCLDPVVTGIPWPWDFMTEWTYGRRDGEVYTIGGGTGIGKTDFIAEIVACTINGKDKSGHIFRPEGVALFNYEAGPATTKKAVAGKLCGKRFHIPGGDWTEDDLRSGMRFMDEVCWSEGGKLFINDSFGSVDWDSVVSRSRYLAHAEGVKHFIIDPISALVMGATDERKELDRIVLEAASLSQELQAKFYLLSHLARPDFGPPHEEGGRVQLKHFRGSNGIGMFSFFVFGLERNQQAEDETERMTTIVRSLKDRYTGNSLGKTAALHYDSLSGTLDPAAHFQDDEELPLDPLSLA